MDCMDEMDVMDRDDGWIDAMDGWIDGDDGCDGWM